MKFLTDVNASGILAKWLEELGHEDVLARYAAVLDSGAIVIADTRKIRIRRPGAARTTDFTDGAD